MLPAYIAVAALLMLSAGCRAAPPNAVSWSIRPDYKPRKTDSYDPGTIDWASVISACKALGRFEKRIHNMFIRATFHDSLTINTTRCSGTHSKDAGCGGADGSLFVYREAEQPRPENNGWSQGINETVYMIASHFNISVADTVAVCGAVAVQELSAGRVQIIGQQYQPDFTVGRLDATRAAPTGQLPFPNVDTTDFNAFWTSQGFTVEEGVALLGSHALLKKQGCLKARYSADGKTYQGSYTCDPATDAHGCKDVRMFAWRSHFYQEACSPSVTVHEPSLLTPPSIMDMTTQQYDTMTSQASCQFTSSYQREKTLNTMADVRAGRLSESDAFASGIMLQPAPLDMNVTWTNADCSKGKNWGVNPNFCPHASTWFYTANDAKLGQACTGQANSKDDVLVRQAMRKYLDEKAWDRDFVHAFKKMVNKGIMPGSPATQINGRECPSGYEMDAKCIAAYPPPPLRPRGPHPPAPPPPNCRNCRQGPGVNCHACCMCATSIPDSMLLMPPSAFNSK